MLYNSVGLRCFSFSVKIYGRRKSIFDKDGGQFSVAFFSWNVSVDESVGVFKWIGLFFMLLTIIFSARKTEIDVPKKNSKFALIICLTLNVVAGAANSILMKYYSVAQGVCDNNSYFFITNLLLFLFGVVAFLISFIKNKEKVKCLMHGFGLKDYMLVVIKTVMANLCSIASLVLIANVNLTIYTVLYSSLNVISVISASIVLKEKLTLKLILAAVFAIAAIVFNVV